LTAAAAPGILAAKEFHMKTPVAVAVSSMLIGLSCRADVSVYLTRAGLGESLHNTYTSGQPINDLPDLSDTGESPVTMVRVFGAPADTIGAISLSGTRATRLDVLLAGASQSFGSPLDPAGANFAGLTTTAGLRSQVRLTAAVSAAVTGAIDCGWIPLLQAGVIDAPVAAHAANSVTNGSAIGTLAISSRVTSSGSITAQNGRIDSATIGSGAGDGLFGSITAGGGKILSLDVTGAIDIASGGISARDGINLLRCRDPETTLATGPINAAIDADTGNSNANDTTTGSLERLECGPLSGSVHARFLSDGLTGGQPTAMIVGTVTAPITVREDMWGNILSTGSFGDLTVGNNMYGTVHAAGNIATVHVSGSITTLSAACFLPNILSDAGGIGDIQVAGDISTTETAGCVPAAELSTIYGPLGIGSLYCAGEYAAHIFGSSGPIPIGSFIVAGDWLSGNVQCTQASVFEVGGDVRSGGIFEQGPSFNTIPAGTTVRIGGTVVGDVIIANEGGLQGQLIVNANGAPFEPLAGAILIRINGGLTSITDPDYTQHASQLGGGVYGAVPFRLYHQECIPESDCLGPPHCNVPMPTITHDQFVGPGATGITLVFKGPILLPVLPAITGQQRVHLHMADSYGRPFDNAPDYGDRVTVTQTGPRSARVVANDGESIPAGRWILEPVLGTNPGFLSTGLLPTAAPNVPIAYFSYNFYIGLDNTPGHPDWVCGSSDFDCDGDVGTDADIASFFACVAGQCPAAPCSPSGADFNGDDDIATDADIEAFFRVLAGGHC
jgi:hypothetical protein